MPRYTFEMAESRLYKTTYVVEADNEDEAHAMALLGVTVEEYEGSLGEVLNREVCRLERVE